MAVAHKLSNIAPRAGAEPARRVFASFRCVESLSSDKAQFEAKRNALSEVPERLAVYMSAGLVGVYSLAFLAQFLMHYLS